MRASWRRSTQAVPPAHDPYLDLVPPQGVKLTPRHYAYLKISEGCNNRCTFCIIPALRGDLVSRPAADVLREAERLVKAGVKELLVDLAGHQRLRRRHQIPAEPVAGPRGRGAASSTLPASSASSASGCASTTSIPTRMSARSFR